MEVCPQFNEATGFVGAATIAQVKLFNNHPTGKVLQRRAPARPGRRRRHPGVRLRAELRRSLPQADPAHQRHLRREPRRGYPGIKGSAAKLESFDGSRKRPNPVARSGRFIFERNNSLILQARDPVLQHRGHAAQHQDGSGNECQHHRRNGATRRCSIRREVQASRTPA